MTRVHIELQRVQTYLFSVPRLRAMVGANTLVGEVLRVRLPELAREQSGWTLATAPGAYPETAPDDPLRSCDDPAADARDGIISRDGGHFEAVFASGAQRFAEEAGALLRRKLPGLRFRISIDRKPIDAPSTGVSSELPVLARCQWTGRGLASRVVRQGDERAVVSMEVARRHEAARRSEQGQAEDLASLLVKKTRLAALRRPTTFQELADPGYLALIHADGNAVGSAVADDDSTRAHFFHRNRVLLRRALKEAIDIASEHVDVAPLLLLMLGGDDVLVVSKAEVALPFVVDLCRALDRLQRIDTGSFRLTLGVGVAIARPTIPIHRLHQVVEDLAASAKRRFRGLPRHEARSVVDWAVDTATWVEEPTAARRRDWIRGSGDRLRVLSRRPLDVLGGGFDSLEGLLRAAQSLEGAPRSQLRYLVDQLPKGRYLSDLAFAELSPAARKALNEAGITQVWTEAWSHPAKGSPLVTSILDLVEVYEIRRLGRAGTDLTGAGSLAGNHEKESSHGQA